MCSNCLPKGNHMIIEFSTHLDLPIAAIESRDITHVDAKTLNFLGVQTHTLYVYVEQEKQEHYYAFCYDKANEMQQGLESFLTLWEHSKS